VATVLAKPMAGAKTITQRPTMIPSKEVQCFERFI